MHPDVRKLMELQKYDLEIKRLRDEMAALPKQVAVLDQKAKATAGQRAVVVDLIAKEESLRRRQESDVRDRQEKIKRLRKQLDGATSTAQVTAFEHEIGFNAGEIATIEDAELESMQRTEELETQKKVADEAVAVAERKHLTEHERSLTVIALDRQALAEEEKRRTAHRAEVGEEALSLYDRIARAKGTGLAEALNQKCMACQMLLRPQRWNDLRERDNHEMFTCESCGRLLFYDPARDAPQSKPVRSESIAARIVRESL